MALNIEALKNADKKLNSGGDDSGLFVNSKDIGEKTLWRVLPPAESLKGIFHFEVNIVWIDKTPLISLSTFGQPCIIQEEHEYAVAEEDDEINELLNDRERYKTERQEWTAGLLLTEKSGKIAVVDQMIKVLIAKPTLMQRINSLAMTKQSVNCGEQGLAEQETGFNIALSKVGQKLKTKYDAQLEEQYPMPAKYYGYTLDVRELAKMSVKPKSYQRAVIRKYLYNEPIPAAAQQALEKWNEKFKEYFKNLMDKVKMTPKKTNTEDAPPAKVRTTKRQAPQVDDEEEYTEYEETAAKPKNKATRKLEVEDEEEETYEADDLPFDAEEQAPRKTPAKKAPAKKSTAKPVKRNIADELEESSDNDFGDEDFDLDDE